MTTMVISLTIADADNELSSVIVHCTEDVGATVTDLFNLYVSVLWGAILPLVDGVLVRAAMTLEYDISGLDNNTLAVTSDIQEKAVFSFATAGSGRPLRVSLPTVKESIFVNSGAGADVDILNADVSAFSVLMTTDVVDNGISATDSHGTDLTRLIWAKQHFGS